MQEDVYGSSMKLYSHSSLDTAAIMSHILSSETGMSVSKLLKQLDTRDGILVQLIWK